MTKTFSNFELFMKRTGERNVLYTETDIFID